MKKTRKRITGWRNAIEGGLRERLESLSPKARLTTVLVMFSLFAAGCLVMLATAVCDFGKGKGQRPEMEHIEKLELPSRERSIVPYDYDAEVPDCETEAGMIPAEILVAYEVE